MKKQLKGHKKELIKGKKYELIVNVGKNPETGIYDRRYRTFFLTQDKPMRHLGILLTS